ncbi:endonuclease domain-containing protein [Nocardioides terrisoli]|uniref:endonuclease domain-containing protein n=1 Tax=Nocardioides terrisoli TaxID=3388267 RepID=UPI00287B813D|nr:hypothetical protein [Nocardioides marmorisolisilvae]
MPVDPTGQAGPTRGRAAGPKWRRTSHGHYVPAATPRTVEQRILEASVRLPPGGAVTGWAACRMHGVGLVDGLARDGVTELPVLLAQGECGRLSQQPGIRLANEPLDPSETVRLHGVPVTTIERAIFDAAREAPDLREAVVALDMAFAAKRSSLPRMATYVEGRSGWRRVVVVRRALVLADEHSLSPQATRLRLIWMLDARLPRPLTNVGILDQHGRLQGIADLLDVEAGLAVEFDGEDHRSRDRHARDVRKEAALRRLGLEVARITGTDLRRTDVVIARLHEARERAAFRSPAERRWVPRPPRSLEEELARRDRLEVELAELPSIAKLRGW